MKCISIFISAAFLLLFSSAAFGQWVEDFSDGDFTNNPTWQGNTDRYVVNAGGQLQLMDTNPQSANVSWLSTEAPVSTNSLTTWEGWVQMSFAPSASNYSRLYLQSSLADLSAPLDGYYLKIGGVSGDVDAVDLYRQSGSTSTLIMAGTPGTVALQPAIARIRVTRDETGLWTVQLDPTGGTNFLLQGTALDNAFPSGNYFGWVNFYTSTRASAFFMDDLKINPLFQDNDPPALTVVKSEGNNAVVLTFSESLDTANLLINQFSVTPGVTINSVQVLNPQNILLQLSNTLQDGQTYSVNANGMKDVAGNTAASLSASFTYVEVISPDAFQVLINELMVDPNPPVAQPNMEYVELWNTSSASISLKDCQLLIKTTASTLPDYVLSPNAYVVLGKGANPFPVAVSYLQISSMGALTDDGATLSLINPSGTLVHQMTYDRNSYGDTNKDEGGYSLELINPNAPCSITSNYAASSSLSGGTPGAINANYNPSQAVDPFTVKQVEIIRTSPDRVTVVFNQLIDPITAGDPNQYMLEGQAIIDVVVGVSSVELVLMEPLVLGQSLQLSIFSGIENCAGVPLDASDFSIGLPAFANVGDWIINEILYNPFTGGSDFVELVNQSDKVLTTADLLIGNVAVGLDTNIVRVTANQLVAPGEIIAFSSNPIFLQSNYPNTGLLIPQSTPSWDDKEGNVSLFAVDPLNEIVLMESVDYNEKWHHPQLKDKNGVSLERLAYDLPVNNSSSWHSASSQAGLATPGLPNSQTIIIGQSADFFEIPLKRISPDNDGYEDILQLNYTLDKNDWLLNAYWYDMQGRLQMDWFQNYSLGSSGSLIWKGSFEEGVIPTVGIYILELQLHAPDGRRHKEKHAITVAKRL